MKSLRKTLFRYILTACLITLTFLLLNLFAYGAFIVRHSQESYDVAAMQRISNGLHNQGEKMVLSQEAAQLLERNFSWGMLLNKDGKVIWSWKLPSDIPTSYTLADAASFSRWYLKDYPVQSWKHADGLLVAGENKGSVWKYPIEMSQKFMDSSVQFILGSLVFNLLLILLLSLFFGFRFYRSFYPVLDGIGRLSRQEPISLPEKGQASDLAKKLNQTSRILEKQNQTLHQRDTARTNWISGVSHDIRTPLSMIMGYAETLEADASLSQEQKSKAAIIKEQSLVIKTLIEDLNLTSKLEYDMQPLRLQEYSPAALLRSTAASFLNEGIPDSFSLELDIAEELEQIRLMGDSSLLSRAFINLLRNSVQHNKNGCHLSITAGLSRDHCEIVFQDDGGGIPRPVLEGLKDDDNVSSPPHIMGLRIVKQIINAHGGDFMIDENLSAGSRTILLLPGPEQK